MRVVSTVPMGKIGQCLDDPAFADRPTLTARGHAHKFTPEGLEPLQLGVYFADLPGRYGMDLATIYIGPVL